MLPPSTALTTPNSGSSIDALLALRGGGRFDPLIQKFHPGNEQYGNFILAILLTFALKPAAKIYFEQLASEIRSRVAEVQSKITKREIPVPTEPAPPQAPYEGSRASKVIETIVEAARLLLLVGSFDIFKTLVECFGLRLPKTDSLTHVFGWGAFLLWGFRRIGRFKLFVLKKTMVHTDMINDPRRLYFINRLTDYALVFFGIFAFYEVLNIEMGYSGQSLLAAFSFATAAIALATKEIITNFLNGVILSASDRIFVGDFISLNGDIKRVSKLGWLETKLRGSDDILYTVPNTELVNAKLSNLSRVNSCQVSQTLRFPYSAMDKLTKLGYDIKAEIRTACPAVITDGSRPFRCYWTNFGKDHLEVKVNAHFRIPPVGDAYYENRQQCLIAIDRAIRRNEIEGYSGGE